MHDCRPKSTYALEAAIGVFCIDCAGRVLGHLVGVEMEMICIALAFVAVYCHFYFLTPQPRHRVLISGMMYFVLQSAFKEIALDPTKTYPAEIISLLPVAYSVYTERKRLKALQR